MIWLVYYLYIYFLQIAVSSWREEHTDVSSGINNVPLDPFDMTNGTVLLEGDIRLWCDRHGGVLTYWYKNYQEESKQNDADNNDTIVIMLSKYDCN